MRVALILLSLAAVAAHAETATVHSACVDLQFTVTKDGRPEQAPRVLAELGKVIAVSQGTALAFSIKPTESGSVADLQFSLMQASNGAPLVFANPRLLVEYGSASSFQVTAPSGETYRIQVSPRRASCPRSSAA